MIIAYTAFIKYQYYACILVFNYYLLDISASTRWFESSNRCFTLKGEVISAKNMCIYNMYDIGFTWQDIIYFKRLQLD